MTGGGAPPAGSDGGDPACWAAELDRSPDVPRQLTATETGALLAADVVAHLATLDAGGDPHVTPIWFLWDGDAFVMTSLADRPHVRRLRADTRAGIVIDVEDTERADGRRPNRQVRAGGVAAVEDDIGGTWTRQITEKYLHGPGGAAEADARARGPRVVIRLVPARWVAVASA